MHLLYSMTLRPPSLFSAKKNTLSYLLAPFPLGCLFLLNLYLFNIVLTYVTYRHFIELTSRAYNLPINAFSWIVVEYHFGAFDEMWFYFIHRLLLLYTLCMLIGLLWLRTIWEKRKPQLAPSVHGTAYFARSIKDVAKMGLLQSADDEQSVIIGAWRDHRHHVHYLRHKGPEHVMAIAPTRSGKGVGLVVPTLLSWTSSCIIHDIKGELWAMTSGWRSQEAGNDVFKFDPASPTGSCSYNILSEIRLEDDYAVSDVQNIVTILVDPHGEGIEGDHWAGSAHSLLCGIILFTLYNSATSFPSLYDVGYQLTNPQRTESKELWEEMREFSNAPPLVRDVIQQTGQDLIEAYERGPEEYASVLSTAKRFLNLYLDPIVQKNTARSDFSINDLVNGARPVSLYIVIRPADKDRLRPLVRLLMTQIMRVLTRDPLKFSPDDNRPLPMHKHPLLMLMDEFPAFKRLDIIEENLAYIAGYGIKCYIICQDFNQLWKEYGTYESITSNCHIRVVYAPNRIETAEKISQMTGKMTVNLPTTTRQKRTDGLTRNLSQGQQAIARPLLTADEIMRLRAPQKNDKGHITQPGDMLIFVAGHPPLYGTQPLYFADPEWRRRSQMKTAD